LGSAHVGTNENFIKAPSFVVRQDDNGREEYEQ
jgi:hypothetical protein